MNIIFVWDGDEAGLWDGENLIASLRELTETFGYSLDYLLGCTQSKLEKLAYYLSHKPEKYGYY